MQGKLIKFKENHYFWGARSHISFKLVIAAKRTIKEHKFEEKNEISKVLARFARSHILIFYSMKFMRQDFEPYHY